MVRKLPPQKRVLMCTFVALVSGFGGAYMGSQISLKAHSHNCQTQPWGLKAVCNVQVVPTIWQGSTTGLWLGLVLGAFISGLATHSSGNEQSLSKLSLCANEIELTPAQTEALRRFLILLTVKLGNSSAEELCDELQLLASITKDKTSNKQTLTQEQARQLLIKLGFSDLTKDKR